MFEVVIVSPQFRDKRLLARHRLVNEALKEEISKVHAFSQVRQITLSHFYALLQTQHDTSAEILYT